MSNKKVFEQIIPKLLNSQFAVIVLLALIIWGASLMTEGQVNTLIRLFGSLANPVGIFLGSLLIILLVYTLFLWPVGAFLSGLVTKYTDVQIAHHTATAEHHEASKEMYNTLENVGKNLESLRVIIHADVIERLEKVLDMYGTR